MSSGRPVALGSEDEGGAVAELDLRKRRAAPRHEPDPWLRRVVEAPRGNPEDRSHRGAQGLRRRRVGASRRERDERRPERIGGPDERADVSRIADVPERQPRRSVELPGQIGSAEDGDDPRRVSERRELGEEAGLDLFGAFEAIELNGPLRVHERVDRLQTGGQPRRDEILSLADEEPELGALPPGRELADELQTRVGGGGDHETHSIVLAWPSSRASRRRPPGHVSTSRAKPWKVGVSRSTS